MLESEFNFLLCLIWRISADVNILVDFGIASPSQCNNLLLKDSENTIFSPNTGFYTFAVLTLKTVFAMGSILTTLYKIGQIQLFFT